MEILLKLIYVTIMFLLLLRAIYLTKNKRYKEANKFLISTIIMYIIKDVLIFFEI